MVLKGPAMSRIRGRGHPDIFVVSIAKKQRRRVEDGVKERETIGPQKPAREMSTLHQTAICLPISPLFPCLNLLVLLLCLFFLSLQLESCPFHPSPTDCRSFVFLAFWYPLSCFQWVFLNFYPLFSKLICVYELLNFMERDIIENEFVNFYFKGLIYKFCYFMKRELNCNFIFIIF